MGAGKVIQLYKTGILGLAINILLAIMLGGIVRNLPQVDELLTKLQSELTDRVEFLHNFDLTSLIFYTLFFFALMIVKLVLIQFFKLHDNSKVWLLRVTSRLIGASLNIAFFVGLWLIFFAVLGYFDDSQFYIDFRHGIQDTWIGWLFDNNPIKTLW